MKFLLILLTLTLSGCFNEEPPRYQHLPESIGRFTDGDVTCWTHHDEGGIFCVKDAHPEGE